MKVSREHQLFFGFFFSAMPYRSAGLSAWPAHEEISHANLCVSLSAPVERQSPWATLILSLHNTEAECVRAIKKITARHATLPPKCALYH